MPLYEYTCASCDHTFEKLRPITRMDDPAPCPDCSGESERQLSGIFLILDRFERRDKGHRRWRRRLLRRRWRRLRLRGPRLAPGRRRPGTIRWLTAGEPHQRERRTRDEDQRPQDRGARYPERRIQEEALREHRYQVVCPGVQLPQVVRERHDVERQEQPLEPDQRSQAKDRQQSPASVSLPAAAA